MVHFLVECVQLCFYFSFQLHQPPGHRSMPDPRCGKGEGEGDPMWTQVGGIMNGVIMSGRGVRCVDKGVRSQNQNQGFPCSTILKDQRLVKEIPRD